MPGPPRDAENDVVALLVSATLSTTSARRQARRRAPAPLAEAQVPTRIRSACVHGMGCSHGMGDGHVRQYRRRKNPWRRLCGAHSRTTGKPSQAPGNGRGGRCKMHGGKCTGPKTEAGRAKIAVALVGQVGPEGSHQIRKGACSRARRSDAAHSQGGACSPAAREPVMTTPEGAAPPPASQGRGRRCDRAAVRRGSAQRAPTQPGADNS